MPVSTTEPIYVLNTETPNCERIRQLKEHVLLPISPYNSKFDISYIERLLYWASSSFSRFDILLPSNEASFLIEATGKGRTSAEKKTRHELNRNMKNIRNAMVAAGISLRDTRIFRFSDFYGQKVYDSIKAQAEILFRCNVAFKQVCIEMSTQAIKGRLKAIQNQDRGISNQQIEIAVKYIFAEIPFFINSPALLNVKTSLLAYHRSWPIGKILFSSDHPLTVNINQGFIQLS
jgi:cyclo(L-leucyl-L-leucyl) synthase